MANDSSGKAVPAYVGHTTFKNIVGNLRQNKLLPSRIDRSVMPGQSGAMQSAIIGAFRFLRLVKEDGTPTKLLHAIVEGNEKESSEAWTKCITEAYDFILAGDLDMARATEQQVCEKLREGGVSGSTLRKAYTFFVQACEESGVALNPLLKPKQRGPVTSTTRTGNAGRRTRRGKSVAPTPLEAPPQAPQSYAAMLLEKFPVFDPTWSDEIKIQWFDGYNRLMEQWKRDAAKGME